MGFPGGSDDKDCACNAGDLGSIPGLGRSPAEGNGNPLQYSFLEIPWTEEPGELQSMGRKESAMTERLTHTHTHTHTESFSQLACRRLSTKELMLLNCGVGEDS